MIRLNDICKYYEMGDEVVKALDHVTLHVQPREFVAIVGASGSGKSTLMNMIGCLDIPDSGQYVLNGEDVSTCTDNELSEIRSKRIGFVFQQFNLLQKLTAYENVELPLIYQRLNNRERHLRVMEALDQVGLGNRMRHRPMQLSGGQQQRVAVARALAAKPSIILADEPTGNLDSKSGEELMQIIKQLSQEGNTILLITHSEKIARQAQRRIRMLDGHVLSEEGNGDVK
ncbi:MAG: ABC transporter ATP-binding protein [Christensenellales bacterium]